MNSMTVKNAAKINLALDVTSRRPDGYHEIESVFQTVGIYDEISVGLSENGIRISCEVPEKLAKTDEIPCDERNIAYKAAIRFFEKTGINCGCNIHIKKRIPSQAGMGGGSSDAAAVLYLLNRLTGSKLSKNELSEIGAKIGADVPFFLTGGTACVSGIGEKIVPIADYSGKILVIAKGNDNVSTAEAYRNIDSLMSPVHPQVNKLVEAINSDSDKPHIYFSNIFEQAVSLESVKEIKKIMTENGALSAVMTGSGSAVFGMFNKMNDAEKCTVALIGKDFFAECCLTVSDSFIE